MEIGNFYLLVSYKLKSNTFTNYLINTIIILGEREFRQKKAARPTATGWHLHVQRLWFYGSDEIGFATAVRHE